MRIHPVAAKGFAREADAYERARPAYAQEAIDWIGERTGLGPGRTVVDVGAGTGKLTRQLVATGARVVAVEPIPEMRAKLDGVEALDGTAEELPLADGSVDLVTAGQAFHWFHPGRAVPELHRVLKAGGWVAILWNTRVPEHPLHQAIEAVFDEPEPAVVRTQDVDVGAMFGESTLFGAVEERVFPNDQMLTRAGLRDRFASTSFIAVRDDGPREALLDRIVALVDGLEEPFSFPCVTEVFLIPRL